MRDSERRRKAAERKVTDLTARLKFADKNRFGDKRYGAKNNPEGEPDRSRDKDDFDG